MGDAKDEEGMKSGIGENNFQSARGRRVPIEYGLKILSNVFQHSAPILR
jgi:hypothetical protein